MTPAARGTPRALEFGRDVMHGVGELGEDEDLLVGVGPAHQFEKGLELGVRVGVPGSALGEDAQQRLHVFPQVLLQGRHEERGAEPLEAPAHGAGVVLVNVVGAGGEILFRPQGGRGRLVVGRIVLVVGVAGEERLVVVGKSGVEQLGVLRAEGQRQVVLKRVEEDAVAQDVALDGEEEGLAAALQALEQVRAAKAHEAAAGAGQVRHLAGLGAGRFLVGRRDDVVGQAVARQVEAVDRIDHVRVVELGVLVAAVLAVDLDRESAGHALGERHVGAVGGGEELASGLRVGLGVVLLDEAAGAADEEEAHEFAPVVGIVAFLEGCEGADAALVAAQELGFAQLAQVLLRADAQVLLLQDEQAELVGQVEVSLVVGRGREQDAPCSRFSRCSRGWRGRSCPRGCAGCGSRR